MGRHDLNLVNRAAAGLPRPVPTASTRPASKTKEQIAAVVKAVGPKPVNLLIGGSRPVAERSRRSRRPPHQRRRLIGALAGAGFMKRARDGEQGTFTSSPTAIPGRRVETRCSNKGA